MLQLLQFVNEGTKRFEELCASPYGEVCDLVLDIVFGAGEIYVDYYLPPLGDESELQYKIFLEVKCKLHESKLSLFILNVFYL